MPAISAKSGRVVAQHSRELPSVKERVPVCDLCCEGAMIVKLERIVAIVCNAAVNLMCEARHRGYGFARLGLRERDLSRTRSPLVDPRSRLVHEQPACLPIAIQVRAMVLHRLEASDRPIELDALLRIIDRQVERRFSDADELGRLQ